jgi:hypothetical protein
MSFAQQFPFISKVIRKKLVDNVEAFKKHNLEVQTISFLLYLAALFGYFLSGFGLGSAHGPDRQVVVDSYNHELYLYLSITLISLIILIAARIIKSKKSISLTDGSIIIPGFIIATYCSIKFLPFILLVFFHTKILLSFCYLNYSKHQK